MKKILMMLFAISIAIGAGTVLAQDVMPHDNGTAKDISKERMEKKRHIKKPMKRKMQKNNIHKDDMSREN